MIFKITIYRINRYYKMTDSTQLTKASGYDIKNMIFSKHTTSSIPNSVPLISYKRIMISTRNPDKSIGDLIFSTANNGENDKGLFSFGVAENQNQQTKKVDGYSMPICLHNRDGASDEEKEWVDTFNKVIDHCKEHVMNVKDEIEKYDTELSDLKKLNPLYYKKIAGKIVEGQGPTLYAKLIVSKKHNKIVTQYFDYDGNQIDPMELIGKYCFVKCAVKIESIFIGTKISMQIKLYEAEVKLMESGMKRLLPNRPKIQNKVYESKSFNPLTESKNIDNDSGSIKDDDEQDDNETGEEEPIEEKKPIKKIVKRKIVKKVTPNPSE
jgi:hypothetical protein